MSRVKGDEKVMRTRQSVVADLGQDLLNQATHGPMHQISIVD
jgi:hypothetical protein